MSANPAVHLHQIPIEKPARISELAQLPRVTDVLVQRLAATAVERDREGGHAARERQWIRESGLLSLAIPRHYGGLGGSWPEVLHVVRELAKVDSALGHVFGFHHLQIAGILLYGSQTQRDHFLHATVRENLFWGNALNPLDKRVTAQKTSTGYVLNGVKSFASGSVGADWLTISAWHEATETALIAVVPAGRKGLTVNADWDAFGQRQTDSGNVTFNAVELHAEEVLQAPGIIPTAQATVRSQVAQLIMTNLYLGIGQGAFDEARRFTQEEARPWFASGVPSSADDPFIQQRYGQLWLQLRPAEVLADLAADLLEKTFNRGTAITAQERGELAVAVAEAKCLAHQAGLAVANQLFDLTGARSTAAKYGYDRYWRNVRVHTLHDPIDYKVRDLGRFALDGRLPEPTAYS